MERSIRLTAPCKEVWRKMHIDVQKSMKAALKALARGEIKGKELTEELNGYSSITEGKYRAIYQIVNDRIIVFHVGHRRNVYKQAPKTLTSTEKDDLETI